MPRQRQRKTPYTGAIKNFARKPSQVNSASETDRARKRKRGEARGRVRESGSNALAYSHTPFTQRRGEIERERVERV